MRTLTGLIAGILLAGNVHAADLTVFAAASMTDVATDIAEAFERQSGLKVTLSFAGSSVLARQISRGAPADVMISANSRWLDYLASEAALADETRGIIASNRLVIVSRADDPAPRSFARFRSEADSRVAVGNPAHVPVGIYARQSLMTLGIWPRVADRLVPAGNTRSAVAFVQRGAADYGVVYRSDAMAFVDLHTLHTLPADSHDPILYEAAMTIRGENLHRSEAASFLAFLRSEAAQSIFAAAGFEPCPGGAC